MPACPLLRVSRSGDMLSVPGISTNLRAVKEVLHDFLVPIISSQ